MAGVTIGTVSRAFNNYRDIHPETKERIFAAAKALGYHPNISARNLARKNPANIALIIAGLLRGDPCDTHSSQFMRGVMAYTMDNSIEISVYAVDSSRHSRQSYKDFCEQHSISGALLSGTRLDDPYYDELMSAGIPVVAYDFPVEAENGGWVSIDNRTASAEAVSALLSSGHKHLAVMSGMASAHVSQMRLSGVMDACQAAGYGLPPKAVMEASFSRTEAFHRMTAYLEENDPAPDAVFCFSDLMAIGVMQALEAKGLRVPKDVSVIGFDGLAIDELIKPSLSTVEQNFTHIGHEAVSMLHGLMTGSGTGGHLVLPHTLSLQESFLSRL